MKYLVGDFVRLFGVADNTVRRYENCGFIKPERDKNNYRYYSKYDIIKFAAVKLFIKCGFSHNSIQSMMGKSNEEIRKICEEKLEDTDMKIARLTRLRHWLKDNIKMMNTVSGLKGDFTTMVCPALRYVIFSEGDEVLKEAERLRTIKMFLYEAPEIQLVNIFRLSDLREGRFTARSGWTIRDMDVEKFSMSEEVKTNRFIEYYPAVNSLYGVLEIPDNDMYDEKKINAARIQYLRKVQEYITENNFSVTGDMVEIYVNTLGNTLSILVYLPIEHG